MLLKESERKSQLREIVTRHLTVLSEKYRFFEIAKISPLRSKDLILLCYEEIKSELFLKYLPVRKGEILFLFDEFFRGSYREYYLEIIQFDFEMYFLAPPDEEETAAPVPQGKLEEILEDETMALRKVYKNLIKQPSQFIPLLEKNYVKLLSKLPVGTLAPDPDELFRLFKGKFPGVDEVYFKPLGKYRERIVALSKVEPKAAEPVKEKFLGPGPRTAAPPPAGPPPSPPETGSREITPAPATGRDHPQPTLLWKDLVDKRELPPQEYYSYIKGKVAEWEKRFESEKEYFHRMIFTLYQASQKFRDKMEQHNIKEMDEKMINAGYLNAVLSIAFAKSAEQGMSGAGVKISIE
ncbi:MAG: hypothetical protein PHE84_11675 [bacterium]|nr:hypothetical protein [bacterium]